MAFFYMDCQIHVRTLHYVTASIASCTATCKPFVSLPDSIATSAHPCTHSSYHRQTQTQNCHTHTHTLNTIIAKHHPTHSANTISTIIACIRTHCHYLTVCGAVWQNVKRTATSSHKSKRATAKHRGGRALPSPASKQRHTNP